MNEKALQIAEKKIMMDFMRWYVPHHENHYRFMEISEKVETLCSDYCFSDDELSMTDIETLIGRILPATLAFFEKF